MVGELLCPPLLSFTYSPSTQLLHLSFVLSEPFNSGQNYQRDDKELSLEEKESCALLSFNVFTGAETM